MSGEPVPIRIIAEADTVLARAIDALGRFPKGHRWVLIGGVAVFLRLGSVTRPTADADTIARSQADLLRQLDDDDVTTVISGGEVRMTVGEGTVDIDIMDLNDDPLPDDVDRRPFALARRGALLTAGPERIIVTGREGIVAADAAIPVATAGALVALKAVPPRRHRGRGARRRAGGMGRGLHRALVHRTGPPLHPPAPPPFRPVGGRLGPHR